MSNEGIDRMVWLVEDDMLALGLLARIAERDGFPNRVFTNADSVVAELSQSDELPTDIITGRLRGGWEKVLDKAKPLGINVAVVAGDARDQQKVEEKDGLFFQRLQEGTPPAGFLTFLLDKMSRSKTSPPRQA